MGRRLLAVLWVSLVLVGCQTTDSGIHSIPVARDYEQLEEPDFQAAAECVAKARRVGAQHHCPYEYYSAAHYLNIASGRKAAGDASGFSDYVGLARTMAEAAIRKGTAIEDPGPAPEITSEDACRAEFDRLKGLYEELDKDKAIAVSPVMYARLTAAMSLAERELVRGEWKRAAGALKAVESDVNAIWSQDVDDDGICDMKDGAPTEPEDQDNFEDEDGAPDPDNDEDAVPDSVDAQPNDAETKNRWHDDDGAPDSYPVLEAIRFTGGAALSVEAKGYLRGVKELINEWPDLKLHLKGVSSASQSETANLDRARSCAEKVQEYLIENGVAQAQLAITFHSDTEARGSFVELILE